jgi:acetylornithine deacetylase/succinyl-diaminopimelate desuccinylase family protein
MIKKERLTKLTQDLIRLNSQNPPGDERKIAMFVKKYLTDLGVRVKIYEFKEGRSNVIAYLYGKSKNSLLITPHLDTVPAGNSWKVDPFKAKIIKNRLYGLGATDCKCNLSASLEVIKSIVEDGRELPYNLIFAATADEECGSGLGLIPLLKKKILNPDAVLVLDADDFDIVITQKGLIHLKVKVYGRKAHGAYPKQGVNAIEIAIEIIREIKNYKYSYLKSNYLKPPTINLGSIKGGDKVNVVSDWCEFELDFRFLPGTKAKVIINKLKSVLTKHVKRFSHLSGFSLRPAKIEVEGIQEPYSISREHNLVRYLSKAMFSVGISPRITGSEGATVITFFQERGIPAIASGFGVSSCAHIADEYVRLDNLYKGTKALEEFLITYKP